MAGVMISLRALSSDTAQLPHISLDSPARQVIGTNTIDCMKSGTILGAASMLDGMIQRTRRRWARTPPWWPAGGWPPPSSPTAAPPSSGMTAWCWTGCWRCTARTKNKT